MTGFAVAPDASSAVGSATEMKPLATIKGSSATLGDAARSAGERWAMSVNALVSTLVEHFDADANRVAVLMMDGPDFVNLICRDALRAKLAKPYVRELFFNKPVRHLLQSSWSIQALELPAETSIAAAVTEALARDPANRFEPVVIVDNEGNRSALDLCSLLVQQCKVLVGTLYELELQRQATQAAERERERLHAQLVASSREAGRAEVATGVLHNVGNVLNSINVSAALMSRSLQESKLPSLGKTVALIREHESELGTFLASDDQGKRIPGYLSKLSEVLKEEQADLQEEMTAMSRSLDHIKQIVQMQQAYAKCANVLEPARPVDLVEDALRVNLVSIERHNIQITRKYDDVETIRLDKHKVLQILINLISNAKNAIKQNGHRRKIITIGISRIPTDAGERVRFEISDNGMGILAENLARIFSHGFTTNKDGHGFGLHSAANFAGEMNGSLTATSDGPGRGATFVLDLPIQLEEAIR